MKDALCVKGKEEKGKEKRRGEERREEKRRGKERRGEERREEKRREEKRREEKRRRGEEKLLVQIISFPTRSSFSCKMKNFTVVIFVENTVEFWF